MMVKKSDGRCEEFSRGKLLEGIQKAFQKLSVTQEVIEAFVDRIVDELSNTHDREVSTKEIGLKVMQELRGMDGVAYVRYASVYRRFEEATEFVNEVRKLEKKDDTLTARLPGI
jgi:transcriptional repressor NrdR